MKDVGFYQNSLFDSVFVPAAFRFNKVYCFFEQSGTFKTAFKTFGVPAYDYDLLDDFGCTDEIIDLFEEIEKAYNNSSSIFDDIKSNDLIFAFFPCTRFEDQSLLLYKCNNYSLINKPDLFKLEYNLNVHQELTYFYNVFVKLCIVCNKRKIPLIIENPFSTQHYLYRYFPFSPGIIHYNRNILGDYYLKPTQYFNFNFDFADNFVIAPGVIYDAKAIVNVKNKVERSLISPEYAAYFIKKYLFGGVKVYGS